MLEILIDWIERHKSAIKKYTVNLFPDNDTNSYLPAFDHVVVPITAKIIGVCSIEL